MSNGCCSGCDADHTHEAMPAAVPKGEGGGEKVGTEISSTTALFGSFFHIPNPKVLRIDMHSHILPKHWPSLEEKYGPGPWIQLSHGHRPDHANMMKNGKVCCV